MSTKQVLLRYWAVLKKYFLTFLKTTVLLPDALSVIREVYRLSLLFFDPIISLWG